MAIEDQRFYEHGGVDHEGDPPRRGQGPRSRRGGRGRLDDHPAAGPQPLHPQPRATTSSARSSRRSWRSSTPKRHSQQRDPRPVPQHRLLRDDRGQHRGRRPGRLADLLLASRSGSSTCRRRRCSPGCRRRPPNTTRSSTRRRRGRGATRCCAKMAKLGYVSPRARPRRRSERGLGLDVSDELLRAPPALLLRLRRGRADRAPTASTRCASGGLEVHTTIDPDLQEVGLEAMRSALPYSTDPSSALVSIDPRNGHIRAMVSSSNYAEQPVQPRRPGPPPAGLDLQGLRPDHRDQAGDRPLLDLLHLETARPRPAALGPLGRRTPPTRATRGRSTCSRRRSPPTTPSSPSSTSTSGPKSVAADGEVDGDHDASSTGSRPRGSAACGSASRRWSWPTPTRPSPPAASTTTRSRSSKVVFPERQGRPPAKPRDPERVALGSRRLRGDAAAARQHHRRDRHRRLHRLRRPGRQDRDHRRIHRRLVRRLPAEPGDRGLGRLPASRTTISMSSVHGITVFGGTFPAEIWHSLYAERRQSPARNSSEPEQPISWAPYYGQLHPGRPRQRQRRRRRRGWRRAAAARQRRGRRL